MTSSAMRELTWAAQGGYGGAGFNPNDFGFDFSGFQQGGWIWPKRRKRRVRPRGHFRRACSAAAGRLSRPGGAMTSRVDAELSFEEAVFGVEKYFQCTQVLSRARIVPAAARRAVLEDEDVRRLQGRGQGEGDEAIDSRHLRHHENLRALPRSGQSSRRRNATSCHGSGVLNRNQEIKVKLPAGLQDGETVRLTGGGEAVAHGTTGDLYIKVHVEEHDIWRKEGHNLVTDLDVKLSDALLGASYELKTLDGTISLKIPEGIGFGEILRAKGKGVPISGTGPSAKHRGDILVKVNIVMPKRLSKDAKRAIEALKGEGV
jgi:molecular chaperone DnaJ